MLTNSHDILVQAAKEQAAENFRTAAELLTQATEKFKDDGNEEGLLNTYLQTGDLHSSFGDYQKALESYFEFFRLAKEKDESRLLLKAYHKIGYVYQSIRDFEEAKKFFTKACKQSWNLKDNREYTEALFALGNVHNWADQLDEAERYLLESLDVARKLNDEKAEIRPISSLAILYTKMGKLDLSLEYFNRGIDLATKYGMKQIRAGMLKSLGNLYIARKEVNKALETLNIAEKEATDLRMNNILLLIHGFYSDAYEAIGEYKLALEHHRKHLQLEKDLMAEEVNLKTKGLQIRFELEEARMENQITIEKNKELEAANLEINKQKAELEVKNKNITDSIVYAERIQRAMLPDQAILRKKFPESFVLFLPRDIVSGDFFWMHEKADQFIIAAVDCTGHGVPGALMSMIGNDMLNHIVGFQNIIEPDEILFHLNREVKNVLKQRENESRDGMDISVCVVDKKSKRLRFAGANNSLWIVSGGRLEILAATKASVGGHTPDDQHYYKHDTHFVPGERIYLFTDGYADQFGGPKGKKFKYRQLKELLIDSRSTPMEEQFKYLKDTFEGWKGNLEQVDDVCIVGIEL